jgi:two-component system cell cycle sensor histidine kinase/response regulator CckA
MSDDAASNGQHNGQHESAARIWGRTTLMMPVMSGYKLGRRLARQRPGLAVLYMSTAARESLVRCCRPLGRTQFLQKPFLPEDWVRHVTESLRPLV